jgi:hypothetical protein
MPLTPFEHVLKEAKRLSPEEQQRLVRELSLAAPPGQASETSHGAVQTMYEAFKARGLVGFMTDGPSDLSTNPAHMEGFGRDA